MFDRFSQRYVAVTHTTPICFQVEQPVITQGSSVTKITFEGRQPPTVTKITGGSSVPKLTSPVTSISPIQASEKTAVSDILKMSLMEAQIDTNVEHMVVDPPKKALATSMLTGEAGSLPSTHVVVAGMANSTPQQQKCRESCSSPSAVGPPLTTRKIDAPGVPTTGQFMRIQNVVQKKAEESPAEIIIQVRIRRNTRNLERIGGCGFGVFWDVTGKVKPKWERDLSLRWHMTNLVYYLLQIYTYFLKQSPRKLIDIVTTAHLRGSQGPWAHVSA